MGRKSFEIEGYSHGGNPIPAAARVGNIIATGGIYDAQTQMASYNFVEPYLRTLFGFLGVTDVTFLTAGGTTALNRGGDRDEFLAPHLAAVEAHAESQAQTQAALVR